MTEEPAAPPHARSVRALARALRRLAVLSQLDAGAGAHRSRSYERAAATVLQTGDALWTMTPDQLQALPGIGAALVKKIMEWREEGRLASLQRRLEELGPGVESLAQLPGVGPKTLRRLVADLGIRSREALQSFLQEPHAASELGAKKTAALTAALDRPAPEDGLPFDEAAALAADCAARLRAAGADSVEAAADLAQGRDVVRRLELLVAGDQRVAPAAQPVQIVFLGNDDPAATRLLTTSDAAHRQALEQRAAARGLTITRGGLRRSDGTQVPAATVAELYAALGLPCFPPETRWGDDALALGGRLGDLVATSDVDVDLHTHTSASDGRATLLEMARAAIAMGRRAIAVTDHSPSLKIAGGLSPWRLRSQGQEIAALNRQLAPFRLLWAAEVDIAADGGLDLPDDLLAALDWVAISVHSHFDLPRARQTARLVRAVSQPHVRTLAHPTARRLGQRPPIACDWDRVFEAAAAHGVALEINGSARRLDLPAELARRAVAHGVRFSLGSDAHCAPELGALAAAVRQARRAFVRRQDVVNVEIAR